VSGITTPLRLGFDIGGTKIGIALGDGQGRLCATQRIATPRGPDWQSDLVEIAAAARALLEAQGLDPAAVEAIGIAAPGPLDPERGCLRKPPNLPHWDQVPLRAWFEDAFGVPVQVENDANAAALAEWRYGAGRGVRDLVYLTLSTGLGAGVIANGALVRGAHGAAGELGHLALDPDGELCACGMRGCYEVALGGAAWARRLAHTAPGSSLALALAGSRERLAATHLIEAARRGDAFALAELARWNQALAQLLIVVCYALDPARIVLGTIATAAGEDLCLKPLRSAVAARLWPQMRAVEIVAAALGDELPARAGLAVAFATD
jgi:glucokinase